MKRKTCFVISPIGDKDSEIRKLANDLFDLIIEPALEKFDFEIIRADKITSSSEITVDIINHVQNTDLCIVDLTGRNPNVMYECGRRHETGKPFIMVAQEGEKLPFDINTRRTFFYNTKDGRAMREVSKTIQEVVRSLIAEGFGAQSSGESLTTISDTLRRIERKLDDAIISKPFINSPSGESNESLDIFNSLAPDEAYAYALKTGDINLACKVFPHVVKKLRDIETALMYSIPIASDSELAATILEDNLIKINPNETDIDWYRGFRNLLYFWTQNDLSKKKLEKAIELTEYFLPYARDNKEKASILNQLQRIYYGSEDYEKALIYAEEVIKTWREEGSYWYNLALICRREKINKLDRALEAINEMLAIGTKDADHLELAIKIFRQKGEVENANIFLSQLREINKYKAEMLEES